jgi:hypothetical protein
MGLSENECRLVRCKPKGADPSPVLAIALSTEQPSPQSIRRLEHEYSFAAELDPAWAAKPLATTRDAGRTILVLKDPGGEPLDSYGGDDETRTRDLCRDRAVGLRDVEGDDGSGGCPLGTTPKEVTYKLPDGTWVTKTICV